MTTTVVFAAYAAALLLALWLLYWRHVAWYWHVLAVVLALVIGLIPTPEAMAGNRLYDLVVGCLFVFLMAWGLGEIFMHGRHRRRSPPGDQG